MNPMMVKSGLWSGRDVAQGLREKSCLVEADGAKQGAGLGVAEIRVHSGFKGGAGEEEAAELCLKRDFMTSPLQGYSFGPISCL